MDWTELVPGRNSSSSSTILILPSFLMPAAHGGGRRRAGGSANGPIDQRRWHSFSFFCLIQLIRKITIRSRWIDVWYFLGRRAAQVEHRTSPAGVGSVYMIHIYFFRWPCPIWLHHIIPFSTGDPYVSWPSRLIARAPCRVFHHQHLGHPRTYRDNTGHWAYKNGSHT